jgi:hypothetical protein
MGERARPCGVLDRRVVAGQPGLDTPRQRIARARLPDRHGFRGGHGDGVGQLARGLGLGRQQHAGLRRVVTDQREAGGQVVADPEDRVHGPGAAQLGDRQSAPLGELHLDQPADDLRVDVELVGVHRHAVILDVGDRACPPIFARRVRRRHGPTGRRQPVLRTSPSNVRSESVRE